MALCSRRQPSSSIGAFHLKLWAWNSGISGKVVILAMQHVVADLDGLQICGAAIPSPVPAMKLSGPRPNHSKPASGEFRQAGIAAHTDGCRPHPPHPVAHVARALDGLEFLFDRHPGGRHHSGWRRSGVGRPSGAPAVSVMVGLFGQYLGVIRGAQSSTERRDSCNCAVTSNGRKTQFLTASATAPRPSAPLAVPARPHAVPNSRRLLNQGK
jgi:hypothetical protein